MSAARIGMQRSLPFIPRSVSRKPNTGNRTVASTGAEATKGVAETPSGTDDNASTSAVNQKELDNVSVAHQSKTYASDSLRKSPGKDAGSESDKTLVSSHDCNSESGKSDLGAPVLLSGATNAVVTDTEKTTVKESQSNSTINQSDNVVSSEPSGFSFSKFVESVCKYNNIDIESKENQPSLQTASTSDNIGPSSPDIKLSTETTGFSFQSFAEAVYKQSNLPLIDVGALSPRRKVALFTRQNQPHYVPKQPIFDAAAVKETVMDKGRELSIAAGKVSPSFRHATEPASKRFKEAVEMGRTRPEPSFHSIRDWELTQCGRQYLRKPKSQQGFDFRVMSYNVLAQRLLEDNSYLYTDCDNTVLKWKNRKRGLMAELRYHRPDIICLQEVEKTQYHDFFKPQLHKMGYDSAYIKRSGNKPDGCATFVNSSKFLIEKSIPIEYCRTESGGILDRDNVALILKLKPLSEHVPSDRRLCVTNTHLLFNPRRGDIKLAQIMVLLAELDKCSHLSGANNDLKYHPTILCGDFNSEPHSELYKLLTMGRLEYEGLLCRVISGQQEGLSRGNNSVLGRHFMPADIGIGDTCQYLDILKSRNSRTPRDSGFFINQNPYESVDLTEDVEDGEILESDSVEVTGSQGTGLLSHEFNLVSAYKHRIGRLKHRHSEITTYHNRAACTVDYIFYGVRCKDVRFWNGEVEMRNIEEGPLHLLGRHGLLADHELQEMGGLPNERLASDHLSLLTSFLLK